MRAARCCRAFWSLVGATGVGLSMLQMGLVETLLALALLSSCATTVLLLVHVTGRSGASSADRPWFDSVVLGVKIGSGVVAAVTIADGSTSIALLLLVVAAVMSPVLLRRARPQPEARAAEAGPGSGANTDPDPDPDPDTDANTVESADLDAVVATLTEPELCALWRSTFWELKMPHTAEERTTLVCLRQRCLDELDRRDPSALRAWLNSGARASGGPERFLKRPHHPGRSDAA